MNDRTNIVTKDPKTENINFYQLRRKVWPKVLKLCTNPKTCEWRAKAIPICFTKVNVIMMCHVSRESSLFLLPLMKNFL